MSFEVGLAHEYATPQLSASSDGLVVVSNGYPTRFWISEDGGGTFREWGKHFCVLGTTVCPPTLTGFAPEGLLARTQLDVHVADDGSIHVIGVGNAYGVRLPYQASNDLGTTWTEPVDVFDGPAPTPGVPAFVPISRPWVANRDNGTVLVVFDELGPWTPVEGPSYAIRTARRGHSSAWSLETPAQGYWSGGPVAADPASASAYFALQASDGSLRIASTHDDGLTWTVSKIDDARRGPFFWYPTTAVDRAGTVYVAWSEDATNPADPGQARTLQEATARPKVHYVFSVDKGLTWSAPKTLSAAGSVGIYPWVLAGDPGRVAILWLENPLGTLVERSPGQWFVQVALSTTADSELAEFVHRSPTESPIRVTGICPSAKSNCDKSGIQSSFYEFFQADIGKDGYVNVVWPTELGTSQLVRIMYGRQTSGTPLVG